MEQQNIFRLSRKLLLSMLYLFASSLAIVGGLLMVGSIETFIYCQFISSCSEDLSPFAFIFGLVFLICGLPEIFPLLIDIFVNKRKKSIIFVILIIILILLLPTISVFNLFSRPGA
jgi:hypothetical protein